MGHAGTASWQAVKRLRAAARTLIRREQQGRPHDARSELLMICDTAEEPSAAVLVNENPNEEVSVMKSMLKKFLNDETGLSAVEYAVAGGLVVLALVTAFTDLGAAVATRIGELVTAVG